jgi:hypothetical protein
VAHGACARGIDGLDFLRHLKQVGASSRSIGELRTDN